jgi:cell division protein FtsB
LLPPAGILVKIWGMSQKLFRQRPVLTVPQIVVLLIVLAGLVIALDLNRRAQAGRLVGVGEEALQSEVSIQSTRQAELQATLAYVQSDEYVASYAREEGGYLLPGEKRIVPLLLEATAMPPTPPAPTPDPAVNARPWQAWWQLLTDAPQPFR